MPVLSRVVSTQTCAARSRVRTRRSENDVWAVFLFEDVHGCDGSPSTRRVKPLPHGYRLSMSLVKHGNQRHSRPKVEMRCCGNVFPQCSIHGPVFFQVLYKSEVMELCFLLRFLFFCLTWLYIVVGMTNSSLVRLSK